MLSKSWNTILCAATLSLGISSCGTQQSSPHADPKIIGGNIADANDEVTTYTVALTNSRGRPFCSGTLAENRRLVVTAGHCVDGINNPRGLFVGFGNNMNASSRTLIRAARIKKHDDYFHRRTPQGDIIRNDMAFILLSEDAPRNFEPIPILPPNTNLERGERMRMSGFGRNVTGGVDGRLREIITQVRTVRNQDKEFTYRAEQSGDDTCNGDSGGSAVVRRNGQLFLVGANSRGPAGCRSGTGVFTNVNRHFNFVRLEFNNFTGLDIGVDNVDFTPPPENEEQCTLNGRDLDLLASNFQFSNGSTDFLVSAQSSNQDLAACDITRWHLEYFPDGRSGDKVLLQDRSIATVPFTVTYQPNLSDRQHDFDLIFVNRNGREVSRTKWRIDYDNPASLIDLN